MRSFNGFPNAFPKLTDLIPSLFIPFIQQNIYHVIGKLYIESQNNLVNTEKSNLEERSWNTYIFQFQNLP